MAAGSFSLQRLEDKSRRVASLHYDYEATHGLVSQAGTRWILQLAVNFTFGLYSSGYSTRHYHPSMPTNSQGDTA